MCKVFCISAGQLQVKKAASIINKRNKYLNYGLLSLATILKKNGWAPIQLHGHFSNPSHFFATCLTHGIDRTTLPVLISVPSFYAITWVNEFIECLKTLKVQLKIIIGGRWVVGNRPELMKELVPKADIVISGIAEATICHILSSCAAKKPLIISQKPSLIPHKYQHLDYTLLVDRQLFQPSIEVSRGCGRGCSFCQEKHAKLQPLKKPSSLISEIKSTVLSDNLVEMTPYFESSIFIPTQHWISEFQELQEKNGIHVKWRTEGRVDVINPDHIKELVSVGLKVMDLGLESASHEQLIKMKKTKDPTTYLAKASTFIKTAHAHGVKIKINILLTAGETKKTISETIEWLEKHRSFFKGVSVGPVIIYGWEQDTKAYLNKLYHYGTSQSHSPGTGIVHLNLSKEISYEKSVKISNEISREFMSPADYFYLKSFSYFSRDYGYDNFLNDLENDKRSLTVKSVGNLN